MCPNVFDDVASCEINAHILLYALTVNLKL